MNARQRAQFMKNQKTTASYYDTLQVVTGQNLYEFFKNCNTRTQPIYTNLAKNTLDNGRSLAIERIIFTMMTIASNVVTAVSTMQSTADGLQMLGGNMSLVVDNGTIIDGYRLLLQLPEFNPMAQHSNAVWNVTTSAVVRSGYMAIELSTPLTLEQNKQFQVNMNVSGVTAVTNSYVSCTLQGFAVLPNPGIV